MNATFEQFYAMLVGDNASDVMRGACCLPRLLEERDEDFLRHYYGLRSAVDAFCAGNYMQATTILDEANIFN